MGVRADTIESLAGTARDGRKAPVYSTRAERERADGTGADRGARMVPNPGGDPSGVRPVPVQGPIVPFGKRRRVGTEPLLHGVYASDSFEFLDESAPDPVG